MTSEAESNVGVVRVGEVPNTLAPVPVEVVTPLPPLATGRGCARVTTCAVEMVTAVVVPLVWSTKAPDVSPEKFRAVPAVVPALIVELMFYPYSYKIFIDPASKVSVPLTVVMRTRSRVPAVVLEPLDAIKYEAAIVPPPTNIHKLDKGFNFDIINVPDVVSVAEPLYTA